MWTFKQAMATADPAVQKVELAVGDATCALPPGQIARIIAAFTSPGGG